MFVRTENFGTFTRLYPIITALTAIHIILWLYITLPFPFSNHFYQTTVGFNFAVEQGEWWRLITPIFLHGSLTHLLFNSISLILFGPGLERILGKGKFLSLYFAGGIIANIATFLLKPSMYVHLGASGAIFALFGIYIYMVFFRPEHISSSNAQIVIVILGISLVMSLLGGGMRNINGTAHLFGFLSGFALSPIFVGRGNYTRSLRDIFPRGMTQRRSGSNSQNVVWIILIALVILGILSQF